MENEKWLDNSIQFPRLLSEISCNVEFSNEQIQALVESMDLDWDDILDIFDRADFEFQKIKEELL